MSYKEKDIIHENGAFWVLRGRDAYYVMKTGATCSTSESAYRLNEDGKSIAVARCDYLAGRAKR